METKDYWIRYYTNHPSDTPSTFAVFCQPRIEAHKKIVDLGCGNKRDTAFFRINGHSVAPIDLYAPSAINKNADQVVFDRDTVVYARFFFHAIDEDVEDKVLKNIASAKARLFAEFRLANPRGTTICLRPPDKTHYRRLIDPDVFISKLEKLGYKVEYTEGFFSPKGEDNPLLGRVIAGIL